MNDSKLVSVVIPVYNVEKYLRSCLDSIIQQTYKNIEIIIVDDGSTDNCPSICDQYAEMDSRIIVIHKTNKGLSDARNKGLEISTGEWITFVDSDDKVAVDMIDYLLALVNESEAEISVCQSLSIDENDIPIETGEAINKSIVSGKEGVKLLLVDSGLSTVAWGKLYRRNLFDHIEYPVGKYHEDIYTTYRIVAKSNRVVIGNERKYYYRKRASSITHISFTRKHLDTVEGTEERANFIKDSFPIFSDFAYRTVVTALNHCAFKMALSLEDINQYQQEINLMQKKYREYGKYYLKVSSNFIAKAVVVLFMCNLRLSIKLLKMLSKQKTIRQYLAKLTE